VTYNVMVIRLNPAHLLMDSCQCSVLYRLDTFMSYIQQWRT